MAMDPSVCPLCRETMPAGTDVSSHSCFVIGAKCNICSHVYVSQLDYAMHKSAYSMSRKIKERDNVQLQSDSNSNAKPHGQELGSHFCGVQSPGIQFSVLDKDNFRMHVAGIDCGASFWCKRCNKMFTSISVNRLSVWKLHSKTCGKEPCGHPGGREGRQSAPGPETQLLPPSVPRPGPSPALGDAETNGVGGNSSTNHTFDSPQAGAPGQVSAGMLRLPDSQKGNAVLRWTWDAICTSRDTSAMPARSGAGEAAPTTNNVVCGETPTTEPSVLNQKQQRSADELLESAIMIHDAQQTTISELTQRSAPEFVSATTLPDAIQTTLSELARDSLPREEDQEAL